MVLPSYIIILVISRVMREIQELRAVKYAFYGIRAGVLALLLKALWTMFRKCPRKVEAYAVVAAAFIVAAFTDLHILLIIVSCAIVGLVTSLIAERRQS